MADEKKQAPIDIAKRFENIAFESNDQYLNLMARVKYTVAEDRDEDEQKQHELMKKTYAYWYDYMKNDPYTMTPAENLFYAVANDHKLLLAKDTQILQLHFKDKDGTEKIRDLFSVAFGCQGLNTPFIYSLWGDGVTSENDDRGAFWNGMISVYRLMTLRVIYVKTPLVKDIIDIITTKNPDLNQQNIASKIFKEFKDKKHFRNLMKKLQDTSEVDMKDIFNNLQKVVAMFSPQVKVDGAMQEKMEAQRSKMKDAFVEILEECEIKNLTDEEQDELMKDVDSQQNKRIKKWTDSKKVDKATMKKIKAKFNVRGLYKMDISNTVANLGASMEKMMAAVESNDEDQMKELMQDLAPTMDLDAGELEKMQKEFEEVEQELNDENELEETQKVENLD